MLNVCFDFNVGRFDLLELLHSGILKSRTILCLPKSAESSKFESSLICCESVNQRSNLRKRLVESALEDPKMPSPKRLPLRARLLETDGQPPNAYG